MTIPLVYIAAPYRAASEQGVFRNIVQARDAAVAVFRMGGFAVCPHLNTAFMGGVVPDQVFLDGDLELLRRCADAVLALSVELSAGAAGEVAEARRLGLPVFDDMVELANWIDRWADGATGGRAR